MYILYNNAVDIVIKKGGQHDWWKKLSEKLKIWLKVKSF